MTNADDNDQATGAELEDSRAEVASDVKLQRTKAGEQAWLTEKERGRISGMKALITVLGFVGRGPARLLLRFVCLWYVALDARARRASRQWLEIATGRPARLRDVYKHMMHFAQVGLDRVLLLSGKADSLEVQRHGHEHLSTQAASGEGAILLGSHLGSFEAMRAKAKDETLPLSIVGNFSNAARVNSLLQEYDPELASRVIHAGDDPFQFALTVRERIEDGGMVALLGDRLQPGGRTVSVRFFGREALFPAGPFLLAATCRCPVYLVFGLFVEPNRYELFCEPFADSIRLPRGRRDEALRETVQRFADRLEVRARQAPYNWFNFFDFWNTSAYDRTDSGE